MASTLDANKDLGHAFVAAWNDRDFDRFDRLMDDDAVLHVGGITVSCSPASTGAIAQQWTTAFPDWHFDLLGVVAEDDRVVADMPYSGTFTNPLFGTITPTGQFARVDEIVIFRVARDKIVEAWEVYDEAGMWRQLRTAPPQC